MEVMERMLFLLIADRGEPTPRLAQGLNFTFLTNPLVLTCAGVRG